MHKIIINNLFTIFN